jgi:hypothetical protein
MVTFNESATCITVTCNVSRLVRLLKFKVMSYAKRVGRGTDIQQINDGVVTKFVGGRKWKPATEAVIPV